MRYTLDSLLDYCGEYGRIRIVTDNNKGTHNGNIYIEDVINVKELQTLQDNWAKATDLAFVTVDVNGKPITTYSNFTPFCEKLRKTDAYRAVRA